MAAVPELAGLGPLFKSSVKPVDLTESETEYHVQCIKHTFQDHIVFQVRKLYFSGPVWSLIKALTYLKSEVMSSSPSEFTGSSPAQVLVMFIDTRLLFPYLLQFFSNASSNNPSLGIMSSWIRMRACAFRENPLSLTKILFEQNPWKSFIIYLSEQCFEREWISFDIFPFIFSLTVKTRWTTRFSRTWRSRWKQEMSLKYLQWCLVPNSFIMCQGQLTHVPEFQMTLHLVSQSCFLLCIVFNVW